MALAGKAAKRMREATGMESHTIAGFLAKSSNIIEAHGPHTYYVVDESSMLDLLTTFRIMKHLPDTVRMVMVGDPYQLPPIGPGLIFQRLVGIPRVPQVTLTEVKRQEKSTGIPTFAAEIRKRSWPTIRAPGVKFIECADSEIMPTVLSQYMQDPERTQVICAVNSCSKAGVDTMNLACQTETNSKGLPIRIRGFNGNLVDVGIRENDRIIFTQNDWNRGVMNGDIGTVIAVRDEPEESFADDDPVIGMALVDGIEQSIHLSDLNDEKPSLALGYAITCHKAQGSQFPRVIVPIKNSLDHEGNVTNRIIDMTWLYTAITRAETEVILVGCMQTAERAAEMGSRGHERIVGFNL
jgi:exodeoxyribonuclease V alpha subunit